MKKKIFTVLVCMAGFTMLSTGISAQEEQEDIFRQIWEANHLDTVLENHQNVYMNVIHSDLEGNEIMSEYIYGDGDICVFEDSSSWVQIVGAGEEYGFNSEENVPYRSVFMEGVYDQYNQDLRDSLFILYDEEEEVISSEQEGDTLTVRTSIMEDNIFEEVLEGDGEESQIEYICEYIVDAESLELQKLNTYVEQEDQTLVQVQSGVVAYDGEVYQPTEELLAAINDEDSRTVTFVADPGTEQEKAYTQSIGKGCSVALIFAPGYEQLYTDQACTQVFEAESDYNSDITAYTKKE